LNDFSQEGDSRLDKNWPVCVFQENIDIDGKIKIELKWKMLKLDLGTWKDLQNSNGQCK
jgi:hypothetical protein